MEDGRGSIKKKDDVGEGGGKTKGKLKTDILKVLDELEEEDNWSFEEELARQNAVVEYYYGVTIGMNYPLLKKINQLENLQYCFWLTARHIMGTTDQEFNE